MRYQFSLYVLFFGMVVLVASLNPKVSSCCGVEVAPTLCDEDCVVDGESVCLCLHLFSCVSGHACTCLCVYLFSPLYSHTHNMHTRLHANTSQGFLVVLEVFTSLALNVESGLFVALMVYLSRKPQYDTVPIPLRMSQELWWTWWLVMAYFLFACLYDIVVSLMKAINGTLV